MNDRIRDKADTDARDRTDKTRCTAEIWIEDSRGLRCTYLGLRKLIREKHLPNDPVPSADALRGNRHEDQEGPRAHHLGFQPAQHGDTATISRGTAGGSGTASHDGAESSARDGAAHTAR